MVPGAARGEERAEPILNTGEHAPRTIAAHGVVSIAQGDTVLAETLSLSTSPKTMRMRKAVGAICIG
jgi:hypothetical protein